MAGLAWILRVLNLNHMHLRTCTENRRIQQDTYLGGFEVNNYVRAQKALNISYHKNV